MTAPTSEEVEEQLAVLDAIQKRAWQTSEDHGFHEAQLHLHPGSVPVIIAALRIHEAVSRIIGQMRDVTPEQAAEGRYELLLEDLLHVGLRSDRTVPLTSPIEESVLSKLVLLHEEVSEAVEIAFDYIAGPSESRETELIYYGDLGAVTYPHEDKPEKAEGFTVELADVAIRLDDLFESIGANQSIRLEKMDYNDRRPHLHGRNL